MLNKYGNLTLLLVLVVLGFIYFMDVQSLPKKEERLIVELLFFSLVILLLIEITRTLYHIVKTKDEKQQVKLSSRLVQLIRTKEFILMIAIILYVVLFPIVGFFVTTFIFLASLTFYLGSRKPLEYLIIQSLVLISLYLIFAQLLDIRFPSGFLF